MLKFLFGNKGNTVRDVSASDQSSVTILNGVQINPEELKKIYGIGEKNSFNKGESLEYSAFWLGSRLSPAISFYEYSKEKKDNPEINNLFLSSFFQLFTYHEAILGLDYDFQDFIVKLTSSSDSSNLKQKFTNGIAKYLIRECEEQVSKWWILGIAFSSMWNMANVAGYRIAPQQASSQISSSLESMLLLLDMLKSNGNLGIENEITEMRDKVLSECVDFNRFKYILTEWATSLECFILFKKIKFTPQDAENLLTCNSGLAIAVLSRLICDSPDNLQLHLMRGGTAIQSLLIEGSDKPLFRTDPLRPICELDILKESLENQIRLDPKSEATTVGRRLLDTINKVY